MQQDELQELKKACDGLDYPSESDAPLEAFRWPGTASGTAQEQIAGRVSGRKIEEVPVDRFFDDLRDSDDAARFAVLRRVFESRLSGLRVFRVGEVKVDIYLVGRAAGGDWVGLHTTSVET